MRALAVLLAFAVVMAWRADAGTAAFGGSYGESASQAEQAGDLLARARALHKQVPLIDGHNDYPWALREANAERDLNKLDIRMPQPKLHTDIPRLRAGGVGGQFWSVYIPADMQGPIAVRATLEQIDIVHRMARKYPDTFELARTAADVERIFRAGRIASLIGMEGGTRQAPDT
jgi:membrane dipeptidase